MTMGIVVGLVAVLVFGIASSALATWLSGLRGCMPFTQPELMSVCLLVGPVVGIAGVALWEVWHPLGFLVPFGVWVLALPLLPWTWYDPKKARWERPSEGGE